MYASHRANLNESYFTDRQDRYLHFKSPSMSNYCNQFLETFAAYCYKLQTPPVSSGSDSTEDYSLLWTNDAVHPEKIESSLGQRLRELQQKQLTSNSPLDAQQETNALIFPIIQGGQFGVREEERAIDLLFDRLDQSNKQSSDVPLVDLTSGYFGLYKPYQELVRRSNVDCRIVCASPKV